MLLKDWLSKRGYGTLEEAKESGTIHITNSEREMKLWFLKGLSVAEILDVLERKISTNYETWEHIEDIDKWIYEI